MAATHTVNVLAVVLKPPQNVSDLHIVLRAGAPRASPVSAITTTIVTGFRSEGYRAAAYAAGQEMGSMTWRSDSIAARDGAIHP
jgi:hypothetical protein